MTQMISSKCAEHYLPTGIICAGLGNKWPVLETDSPALKTILSDQSCPKYSLNVLTIMMASVSDLNSQLKLKSSPATQRRSTGLKYQ